MYCYLQILDGISINNFNANDKARNVFTSTVEQIIRSRSAYCEIASTVPFIRSQSNLLHSQGTTPAVMVAYKLAYIPSFLEPNNPTAEASYIKFQNILSNSVASGLFSSTLRQISIAKKVTSMLTVTSDTAPVYVGYSVVSTDTMKPSRSPVAVSAQSSSNLSTNSLIAIIVVLTLLFLTVIVVSYIYMRYYSYSGKFNAVNMHMTQSSVNPGNFADIYDRSSTREKRIDKTKFTRNDLIGSSIADPDDDIKVKLVKLGPKMRSPLKQNPLIGRINSTDNRQEDWEQKMSRTYNKVYWHNTRTGMNSWQPPTDENVNTPIRNFNGTLKSDSISSSPSRWLPSSPHSADRSSSSVHRSHRKNDRSGNEQVQLDMSSPKFGIKASNI